MSDKIQEFIHEFAAALSAKTFVKLTLSNYKGTEQHLQKILARLVETKKGTGLFVQFRYDTRDIVKNYDLDEGVAVIRDHLNSGFRNAHLFTTANDLQLDIGKRSSRLNVGKPTIRKTPSLSHDRQKADLIDPNAYYLKALGITTDGGEIKPRQNDKWKQINKFVEIVSGLYDRSTLKEKDALRIIDMGSGKGYLTFAVYDYFRNTRDLNVTMTGVDTRRDLIGLCSDIAEAGGFEGLTFVNGSIDDTDVTGTDILIALHACDTATDDALYKAISGGSDIVVTAPCCHREVRAGMTPPAELHNILKHPVLLDRTAEVLTDGLRALVLEQHGYKTKVFEFVATEHTPKNTMIVGQKTPDARSRRDLNAEIARILASYKIADQRLVKLTKNRVPATDRPGSRP